ncbi:MAG: hypothetical protein Q9223_002015 [Gallowayella weberi]
MAYPAPDPGSEPEDLSLNTRISPSAMTYRMLDLFANLNEPSPSRETTQPFIADSATGPTESSELSQSRETSPPPMADPAPEPDESPSAQTSRPSIADGAHDVPAEVHLSELERWDLANQFYSKWDGQPPHTEFQDQELHRLGLPRQLDDQFLLALNSRPYSTDWVTEANLPHHKVERFYTRDWSMTHIISLGLLYSGDHLRFNLEPTPGAQPILWEVEIVSARPGRKFSVKSVSPISGLVVEGYNNSMLKLVSRGLGKKAYGEDYKSKPLHLRHVTLVMLGRTLGNLEFVCGARALYDKYMLDWMKKLTQQ